MSSAAVARLDLTESHRVLTEIAALSASLDRLVLESVQAVLSERRSAAPVLPVLPVLPVAPAPVARVVPPAAPAQPTLEAVGASLDAADLNPDRVLGKDKGSWSELTKEEQSAARGLGYDATSWDAGMTPEVCNSVWRSLAPALQRAAGVLGYTAADWNDELGVQEDELEPMPPVLPLASTAAAMPPPRAPTAAPPPGAARSVATDGSVWSEMTAEEQNAALLIGYEEASWDNGLVPDTCNYPWLRLSSVEQNAARVLGYTPEAWDADIDAVAPPSGGSAPPSGGSGWSAPVAPALAPLAANGPDSWMAVGGRGLPASKAAAAQPPSIRPSLRDVGRFDSGLIFGCKRDTYDENMTRRLFGLPAGNLPQAQRVGDATALFLFNHTTRQLHGVFIRDGPMGMNLEPQAWAHKRGPHDPADQSPYPAQVRWQPWIRCNPIAESVWGDVPTVRREGAQRGKGPPPQYELVLTGDQARRLAQLCMRHGAGVTS